MKSLAPQSWCTSILVGKGLLAARDFRPPLPLEVLTAGKEVTAEQTSGNHAPCTAPPEFVRTIPSEEKRPQIEGRCQVVSGPWSLEPEWWMQAPAERDYWDVELLAGAAYRIFRDRGTGEWFADGIYD